MRRFLRAFLVPRAMAASIVSAAWLALCVGCSQPAPQFAHSAKLKCSNLQVPFYGERTPFSDDADFAVDPSLGWAQKLTPATGRCDTPSETDFRYCERFRRTVTHYSRLGEPPLDALGASEAFRGIYEHSFGSIVVVRVVRTATGAVLLTKVLDRHRGPWTWSTSRSLSDAEWMNLRRAAPSVPEGVHEYFPRSEVEAEKAVIPHPGCYVLDGAGVRIEQYYDGVLNVVASAYFSRRGGRCDGACCPAKGEAVSRFFDELLSLVQCAKPEP